MEIAGDDIIKNYCPGYETSTSSYILPPLFDSEYPEERNPHTLSIPLPSRHLTSSEYDRYTGICTNQRGEICENRVFTLFHQIKYSNSSDIFILLRNLDLDNNNDNRVKENELIKELPYINLSRVSMKGEHDFVMIIKDIGIVLIEVKSTIAENSIKSAEKQLGNGMALINALIGGIKQTTHVTMPVAKIIIAPEEKTPSPLLRGESDILYQIHEDHLTNMSTILENIVQSLRSHPDRSCCTSADFGQLTRILIGLWCLTPARPGLTFSTHAASTTKLTKDVDAKLDKQIISSFHTKSSGKRKYTHPVTDVHHCAQNEVIRKSKVINSIFLTPTQKQILDQYPRALIIGGPGSGKTMIMLFKCIELIQYNKKENFLLIVPPPHDQRCKMILRANGITAEIIEQYPPKHPTSWVYIISLKNFFAVRRDVLLGYDLGLDSGKMNVFLDDMQAYNSPSHDENIAKYDDIVEFIEQTYEIARQNGRYFWCCFDVLQGGELNINYDENPLRLLHLQSGARRSFKIPTVEMTKILRNSQEIITVVDHMRALRIKELVRMEKIVPDMPFCEISPGHNITSAPVTYHKLKQGTDTQKINAFVLQMIEKEVSLLLLGEPRTFNASDVAILRDGGYLSDHLVNPIQRFLHEKFNLSTQCIQESIESGNEDSVVSDERNNCMSYEVPCVVYISTYRTLFYNSLYVLTSRARCRLTVIDTEVSEPPITTENVTLVTWVGRDGSFEVQ